MEGLPKDIFGEPPAEPDVSEWMESYWQAFQWLHRFREQGAMGNPMPISLRTIESYVSRFGPDDPDEFDDFVAVISVIDAAWLDSTMK